MTAKSQLVIDCADPELLAGFWVAALGYEFEPHAELESRMDAADARLAAEGKLVRPWREVHQQQRDIAAAGWPGQIIHIGHTTRPSCGRCRRWRRCRRCVPALRLRAAVTL
jgi:Glyoxalase-like domain